MGLALLCLPPSPEEQDCGVGSELLPTPLFYSAKLHRTPRPSPICSTVPRFRIDRRAVSSWARSAPRNSASAGSKPFVSTILATISSVLTGSLSRKLSQQSHASSFLAKYRV